MNTDIPIFDIPIYRCTPEEHSLEVEATLNKQLDNMPIQPSERERWKQELRLRHDDKYWMRWRYNHTIGWLQLYTFGADIHACEYWVTAKHITPCPSHKTFAWNKDKAITVVVFPNMSDAEIYSEVDKELLSLAKSKQYRKRYIDLTNFHNIGPYVRWKELLNPKE